MPSLYGFLLRVVSCTAAFGSTRGCFDNFGVVSSNLFITFTCLAVVVTCSIKSSLNKIGAEEIKFLLSSAINFSNGFSFSTNFSLFLERCIDARYSLSIMLLGWLLPPFPALISLLPGFQYGSHCIQPTVKTVGDRYIPVRIYGVSGKTVFNTPSSLG